MNISDEEIRATRGRLLARGDELRERVRRVRLDLARANYSLPKDSAEIAAERLRAVPHATRCWACERG